MEISVGDKVFGPGRYFGVGVGVVDCVVLAINGQAVTVKLWNGEIQTANIHMLWK